jgi:LysM repeat protein
MSVGLLVFCVFLSVPVSASEYTVVKGDCLWRISQAYFGTGMRWVEIFEANRGAIRDPNLIYPGQVFTIPGVDAKAAEPEKTDSEPAASTETEPEKEETVETPKVTATVEGLFAPLAGTASDYADAKNWASLPEAVKNADTLYVYPTVYCNTAKDAPAIVPIEDETMRAGALENIELNCGVFSETTNVFVPFYRQSNLSAVTGLSAEELQKFQMQEQRTDLYAALDYYFEKLNGGRPFILAGHGQGSLMGKIILEEYMQVHPEYSERMIAAYLPGYSVTEDDLKNHPTLRFAEGADDTGVIVSWNTEGLDNGNNFCVLPGALAINPLNWTLDGSYSYAIENKGSRIVNSVSGKVDESKPGLADAQVDLTRGVVICYNVNLPYMKAEGLSGANPFGEKSYHNGDYLYYFRNIEENVQVRTEAWFAAHKN